MLAATPTAVEPSFFRKTHPLTGLYFQVYSAYVQTLVSPHSSEHPTHSHLFFGVDGLYLRRHYKNEVSPHPFSGSFLSEHQEPLCAHASDPTAIERIVEALRSTEREPLRLETERWEGDFDLEALMEATVLFCVSVDESVAALLGRETQKVLFTRLPLPAELVALAPA